jgi:hypothetical protein
VDDENFAEYGNLHKPILTFDAIEPQQIDPQSMFPLNFDRSIGRVEAGDTSALCVEKLHQFRHILRGAPLNDDPIVRLPAVAADNPASPTGDHERHALLHHSKDAIPDASVFELNC